MDLNKTAARIRPRNHWEAIDLGILMAKQWARPLLAIWFASTLPVYIVLALLLREHPEVLILVMWWLKPIFDRPLLHFISLAMFGTRLSWRQTLGALKEYIRLDCFHDLTTRRFSPSRSLLMPIGQLERLSGSKRRQRINAIERDCSGISFMLTISCFLLSYAIVSAIGLLFMLMTPQHIELNWDYYIQSTSLIERHVEFFILYICMSLIEPFYVASGFSLYINRRTLIECWDIELAFKRMSHRLQNDRSQRHTKTATTDREAI